MSDYGSSSSLDVTVPGPRGGPSSSSGDEWASWSESYPKDGQLEVHISLEGIVGVGKSTVLRSVMPFLEDDVASRIRLVDEPLGNMRDCLEGAYDALDELYSDPAHNGVVAQLHIAREVRRHYDNESRHRSGSGRHFNVLLSDRSALSSFPFIDAYHSVGIFRNFTRDWLTMEHRRGIRGMLLPSHVILMSGDVSDCHARLLRRGGAGDPLSWADFRRFQSALERAHHDFFDGLKDAGKVKLHHVRVTSSQTKLQVAESVARIVNSIVKSAGTAAAACGTVDSATDTVSGTPGYYGSDDGEEEGRGTVQAGEVEGRRRGAKK